MAEGTGIEWADQTWNPLAAFDRDTGKRGWFCTKVSPGCANCYAEDLNERLGTGHAYAVPNLEEIEFRLVNLDRPLQWQNSGKRYRIFVNSMTDLFHEAVPDSMLDRVFAAMAIADQHIFQILTKRPDRMAKYLSGNTLPARLGRPAAWIGGGKDPDAVYDFARTRPWPLPNVWCGTSVEDQERADERIPQLLRTPAAVRFLSCEPLLGSIDLGYRGAGALHVTPIGKRVNPIGDRPEIDWIIVGGESGSSARPMQLDWAARIVEQCQQAGAAVFVKQLGSVWAGGGRKKGGNIDDWPEVLRVREFPEAVA